MPRGSILEATASAIAGETRRLAARCTNATRPALSCIGHARTRVEAGIAPLVGGLMPIHRPPLIAASASDRCGSCSHCETPESTVSFLLEHFLNSSKTRHPSPNLTEIPFRPWLPDTQPNNRGSGKQGCFDPVQEVSKVAAFGIHCGYRGQHNGLSDGLQASADICEKPANSGQIDSSGRWRTKSHRQREATRHELG